MTRKLRRRVRSVIDWVGATAGVVRLLEARMRRGVTILTYHRVLPDEQCDDYPFPSLAMPVSAFRDQVKWLSAHCSVMPVVEAIDRLAVGETSALACVCLTFDDGYRDNYEVVASVLDEYGLRATFFVAVGAVELDRMLWFDRAADQWAQVTHKQLMGVLREKVNAEKAEAADLSTVKGWMDLLKKCDRVTQISILEAVDALTTVDPADPRFGMMRIGEVVELDRVGHEIASHTVSHPILPMLDEADVDRELVESRRKLEEWLGTTIRGFCYPNGDFDEHVVSAVRKAGYTYACTTTPGMNMRGTDPLRLARIDVTAAAVSGPSGEYDELAFRSEICRFHQVLR